MPKTTEFAKYPLEKVCRAAEEILSKSEFLVERLDLILGRDYQSLKFEAHWDPKWGTASVKVTVCLTKQQDKHLRSLLDDEVKFDDFDSGIYEAFHSALSKVYPRKKWSSTLGNTAWDTIVEKRHKEMRA